MYVKSLGWLQLCPLGLDVETLPILSTQSQTNITKAITKASNKYKGQPAFALTCTLQSKQPPDQ